MGDHWSHHARQWRHVGEPLRPPPGDIDRLRMLIADAWPAGRAGPAAVLLGVTPEIATMAWPAGTELVAVDRSTTMIEAIWPGDHQAPPTAGWSPPCRRAIGGDWRRLPVASGSADFIVGDGSYSMLESAAAYRALTAEVVRVLRPGGWLLLRAFVRPDVAETPAAVIDDARAGRIGSFAILKWRLAMALHGPTLDDGVRLDAVWRAWREAAVDLAALQGRAGWDADALATLEVYRGVATRYTFPTLGELRAVLGAGLVETAVGFPAYELGGRCPTLGYRKPA